MTIASDIQKPSPGTIIELFVLDLTTAGFPLADPLYFYSGVDSSYGDIVFDGDTYTPLPLVISGIGKGGDGPLPRPTLTISNVDGFISQQLMIYNDLMGATVTKYKTFARYLDAGASPDPTARNVDIYFVEQKKSETNESVQLELVSAIDVMDKQLPGRTMINNTCSWVYKSAECSWPGTDPAKYFDDEDNSTGDPNQDNCSKTLNGCSIRFGALAELPYGSFPALGRLK